jgi:hypothetical protein
MLHIASSAYINVIDALVAGTWSAEGRLRPAILQQQPHHNEVMQCS